MAQKIERPLLDVGPVPRGKNWLQWINQPQTEAELKAMRESVNRDRPYGAESWQKQTAKRLGLEHSMRSRGRPRKDEKK